MRLGASGGGRGMSRCGASSRPADAARRVQTPPKPAVLTDAAALVALREDRDGPALPGVLEVHDARAAREDRVVAADAGTLAGVEARAALADDDLTAGDLLAGEHLHAEALGVRVATVAAGAESLLMSQSCSPP